jgi:hypothetical protein
MGCGVVLRRGSGEGTLSNPEQSWDRAGAPAPLSRPKGATVCRERRRGLGAEWL